jgi:hypothetical protein
MSTVPFGKYKGRPVEEMLADASYMAWLEAQPWFRERFAHMTGNREDLGRTPEHNKLQAIFLDNAYCWAFALVAGRRKMEECLKAPISELSRSLDRAGKERELALKKLAELDAKKGENRGGWDDPDYVQKLLLKWDKVIEGMTSTSPVQFASARFEYKRADVFLTAGVNYPSLRYDMISIQEDTSAREFRIEVKPVVADDYPVVLRQMERNETSYLFLERYTGEGVTEDQFIEIFRRSNKIVVFKRNVDDAMELIP